MSKRILTLSAAVLLAGLLGGCNKFTAENYRMISPGMSQVEVENILGPTELKFSDQWNYEHDDPAYAAVIKFKDGKVTDKAWSDEHHIDQHPDVKNKTRTGDNKIDDSKGRTESVP